MKRDKYLFAASILIFFIFLSWGSSTRAEMIKEVAIGVFYDAPNEVEMERYYLGKHGPRVALMSGPWMRRYRVWLPLVPPDEAVDRFGAVRGRYAELWYDRDEYVEKQKRSPSKPLDTSAPDYKPPVPWERDKPNPARVANPVVMVQAIPTETFYNSKGSVELELGDNTFIRWVTIMRYPEEVPVEEGEKWFLNVHAKEAVKQPGLLRFESYRVIPGLHPSSEKREWVRVNEYWYDDFDAWHKAVIESPPKYTAPSWRGEYPFVEMWSTFIPYMHYADFLRGDYVKPIP